MIAAHILTLLVAGSALTAELPSHHEVRFAADLGLVGRFVPLRTAVQNILEAPRNIALARGLKTLGIDPLRDLKQLAIGWQVAVGGGPPRSLALIAGNFSRRRVESGLRKLKSGRLIEQKHRRYTLWVDSVSGQMLSLRANGKALMGSPASVRAGLYSKRKPRKRPQFLRGAPVWFEAPVTPALRRVLGDTDPGSPLALVRRVRARLDLVEQTLRLQARLNCASSADANGLSMTLNLAATALAFRQPKLAVLLARVGFMPQGKSVVVRATIDRETLAKIVALGHPRPANATGTQRRKTPVKPRGKASPKVRPQSP
jgi:hypothetical protein